MNTSRLARGRGRPRDWHDKTGQNTVKSLDRAMAVLERLSEIGASTLSEIAHDTGQAAATVYRILVTLETRGLAEFDPRTQTWAIGARAYVIGARYLRRTSLVERARPILRDLMETTGETANLGIERGGQVLFVAQTETHASIRAFFPPGTLSPMHASGIGKAILSAMGDARRDRIISAHGLERFTANTITDPRDLLRDLDAAKANGFAVDREERTPGMICVAAPVRDATGEVAAGISVSGPAGRMTEQRLSSFAGPVVDAASALTAAIGG